MDKKMEGQTKDNIMTNVGFAMLNIETFQALHCLTFGNKPSNGGHLVVYCGEEYI